QPRRAHRLRHRARNAHERSDRAHHADQQRHHARVPDEREHRTCYAYGRRRRARDPHARGGRMMPVTREDWFGDYESGRLGTELEVGLVMEGTTVLRYAETDLPVRLADVRHLR